jgi:hypothetical protein
MTMNSQKMSVILEIAGAPSLYELRDVFQNLGDDFPASSHVTYIHFSDDDGEGTVCFEYET